MTGVDSYGHLDTDLSFLESSKMQKALPVFYPYINAPLSDYFDAFMSSSENILILFGEPGTGKSTFLRSLITHRNSTAYLAYSKEAVEDKETVRQFYRSDASILAYEDCDAWLGSREGGNSLMSTFLNSADGVIQERGKKIVFSTNLNSLDKIDPALLRSGRCFDIIKFELLTVSEANDILKVMNLPERDFTAKDKWTLSEVLNKPNPFQQTINRYTKKLGF